MRLRRLGVLAVVIAAGSLAAGYAATAGNQATPVPAPAFSASQLVAASGDDWISYNGNSYNQRYSSLTQITRVKCV